MNEDSQWNNNRVQNQENGYSGRKQSGHKFNGSKRNNYSPSASYYYHKNGQTRGQSYQQHPRRRSDRYKRESINYSEKVVRQNDIIIRLLKEIRDRLPSSKIDNNENDKGQNQVKLTELDNNSDKVLNNIENDKNQNSVSEKIEKTPEVSDK